mgnify:CR=1 FL=1
MLEDDELMKLMVKSGCLGHVIGFESIKPESINAMGKGVNKKFVQNQYKEAIKADDEIRLIEILDEGRRRKEEVDG